MRHRVALYGLLVVVAAAAAVLSFSALRDLALVCGFDARLAWLLPVTVDAGAAAGSIVWLARWTPSGARTYGRSLALALLGLSVAANAVGHGLAAFHLAPAWWVVVIVSAVAPAVLGAVVHLVVLVGRQDQPTNQTSVGVVPSSATPTDTNQPEETAVESETVAELVGRRGGLTAVPLAKPTSQVKAKASTRAAELVASGAGRKRLMNEAGLTEYEARKLLAEAKQERA